MLCPFGLATSLGIKHADAPGDRSSFSARVDTIMCVLQASQRDCDSIVCNCTLQICSRSICVCKVGEPRLSVLAWGTVAT